jgi:hypothetical protein
LGCERRCGWGRRTTGPFLVLNPAAVASKPTIRAISWTKAFVSRAFAVLARSWESFAWRHGCVETCTLGGSECAIVRDVYCVCSNGREETERLMFVEP